MQVFQSSAVFVYALSVPLLGESVTRLKVAAVVVSLAGLALVVAFSTDDHQEGNGSSSSSSSSSSSGNGENTWQGYALLAGSIFFFACYEVGIKMTLRRHGDIEESLALLGLVGVWTAMVFWPAVFIEATLLSGSGALGINTIISWDQVYLLLINTIMDAVINASLFAAIALVSPLFATMGLMLLIPVGIVVDALTLGVEWSAGAYVGTAAIVVGFGFLAHATIKEQRRRGKEDDDELPGEIEEEGHGGIDRRGVERGVGGKGGEDT